MGRNIPVFSIRCGQDPYGFIGKYQGFNGLNVSADDLAGQLCDAYCRNKTTKQRMADVLVQHFIDSNSFAEAQSRAGMLDYIQAWNAGYEKRLNDAVRDNYQISHSFHAPGVVRAVINRWKNAPNKP